MKILMICTISNSHIIIFDHFYNDIIIISHMNTHAAEVSHRIPSELTFYIKHMPNWIMHLHLNVVFE